MNLLEPIGFIDERFGQSAHHSSDDPVAPYDCRPDRERRSPALLSSA
jgi:hypothetical protein